MCLNCTLAFVVSSVPPQTPTDSPRELLHKESLSRLQIADVHESVLRGPSKMPELLNSPTVFNRNHSAAPDGDKPLTECEEESLVEEETRAGGHDESGDTCNLLYQARQALEAQKFGLFHHTQ